MYQALYRKYRPKTLDDVCGQETIVTIIKNSIKNNQLNHAYLFAGPRGTGKTSVAKILAKIVNCQNLKECTPCNECPSCTEASNSDIIEIDAASNNGVDEIRELRNKVNLVPAFGKYKVYIIDEVHMLTVGAFNALLKTLEEPPEHIIFILATTDPQKIPETILSRCQRLDFKKISMNAIMENLKKISQKENIDIEENALKEIARLSDGGMRDSVGMLDQVKAYTEQKITQNDVHMVNGTLTDKDLEELLNATIQNNLETVLKNTDRYNENGKNFTKLIEEYINYLRNVLLYKKVPKYFKENHENIDNYDEISKKISDKDLFHFIEILNKYSNEMKQTNNTKLMFELAFIEMTSEKNSHIDIQNSEEEKRHNKSVDENKIKHLKQTIVENFKEETKESKDKIVVEKEKVEKKVENSVMGKTPKEKNTKLEEFINYIKKIRIDNTLYKFNKKEMIEIKNKLQERLSEQLMNPDYSQEVSMLLDGNLKAASEENLIFMYKTPRISYKFNENLVNLESAIENILEKKYKLIAVASDEWETIKDEFNHKKRKFEYKKEDFDLEEVFKDDTDDITKMFEDIIEYN